MTTGPEIHRRDFLIAMPAAAGLLAHTVRSAALATLTPHPAPVPQRMRVEPFDYHGVRLGASRWRDQYLAARAFYLAIPDDDILHGYRATAGLPAPGAPLGGWCGRNSDIVFGQWLSGFARMASGTGDDH